MTIVVLASPYVPAGVSTLLAMAAVTASGARVYQGAHHPVDAVGGAGLGLAVGSAVNLLVGVPRRG